MVIVRLLLQSFYQWLKLKLRSICWNWQAQTASQQMKCTSSAEKKESYTWVKLVILQEEGLFQQMHLLVWQNWHMYHLMAVLSGWPILNEGKCRKTQSIIMTTAIQLQKIACNEICIHLNLSLFNFTVSGKKKAGLIESL